MQTLKRDVAAFVAERLWVGGGRTLAKPQGVVQARPSIQDTLLALVHTVIFADGSVYFRSSD